MKCCSQCDGLERLFDERTAERELLDYRRHGATDTTRALVETLTAHGVNDMTLLDIGGGVGAIQHLLAQAGVRQGVNVDASTAYQKAARREAQQIGYADRMTYQHGDFVALAPQIEPADIVTLDRVICCYPDMPALVNLSAARARRFYGLIFPRDVWWIKLARPLMNGFFRLQNNPFRFFVHPTEAVESLLRQQGMTRLFRRNMGMWQVMVYAR